MDVKKITTEYVIILERGSMKKRYSIFVILVLCILSILPSTYSDFPINTEREDGKWEWTETKGEVYPDHWKEADSRSGVQCSVFCKTNSGVHSRSVWVAARVLNTAHQEVQMYVTNYETTYDPDPSDDERWEIDSSDSGLPSGAFPLAENDYNSKHRYMITFKEPQNNNGVVTATATYHHEIGCNGMGIAYSAQGSDWDEDTWANCGIYINGVEVNSAHDEERGTG